MALSYAARDCWLRPSRRQQVGTGRVVGVITGQLVLETVDGRQRHLRAVRLGDRDGPVEGDISTRSGKRPRKAMARMGISTIASYRNSQLFETIGLDEDLRASFFEDAGGALGGKGLDELLEDCIERHAAAFRSENSPTARSRAIPLPARRRTPRYLAGSGAANASLHQVAYPGELPGVHRDCRRKRASRHSRSLGVAPASQCLCRRLNRTPQYSAVLALRRCRWERSLLKPIAPWRSP